MSKLKTKFSACFSAAILLCLLAVGPVMSLSAYQLRDSSAKNCLSPKLGNQLSGLSEKEYIRLKNRFEKTRDPEDLRALFETLNPILQRAFFNGFLMEMATVEQRPAQKRFFLSPNDPAKGHNIDPDSLIEIINGNKERAKKEFFQKYGHSDFIELMQTTHPAGPYQNGTEVQSVYPFCCGTACAVVSNLLLKTEGLRIYKLDFNSTYKKILRPFDATQHFATLILDIVTGSWYYISLTDGQFVVPRKKDGSKGTTVDFGFLATDKKPGYLGADSLFMFSHPDYLKWYFRNGLDKVYFSQVTSPSGYTELDSNDILNAVHRSGFVPDEMNVLQVKEIVQPFDIVDRDRMLEFMPQWLAETINKTAAESGRLSQAIQKSA